MLLYSAMALVTIVMFSGPVLAPLMSGFVCFSLFSSVVDLWMVYGRFINQVCISSQECGS